MNTLCGRCANRRYVRKKNKGKHWCMAYQKPIVEVKCKCERYNLTKNL